MDNQKSRQPKVFGLVHGTKIIIHFFFYTTNNYFGKYLAMAIGFYELLRLLFLAISVFVAAVMSLYWNLL